jgi:hypothetical protein
LAALAGRMDAINAAPVAERLAKALENPQERDPSRLNRLGSALAALVGRMDATNAAPVAERLAKALENPQERDPSRLSRLGSGLAALVGRMDTNNAARMAGRGALVLAIALENSQEKDSFRLRQVGSALAALAGRMNATNAAPVAERLAKALENPQEMDSYRLRTLGEALAVLAGRMDATSAAPVAGRAALVVAGALERSGGLDYNLSAALASVSAEIPTANTTRLAALSLMLLKKVEPLREEKAPEPLIPTIGISDPQHGTTVSNLCSLLATNYLVEVLKWPFCVDEAQKLVLAELQNKLEKDLVRISGQKFDGDLWKFVEQAPRLGFSQGSLDAPAKRPQIADAIAELQAHPGSQYQFS